VSRYKAGVLGTITENGAFHLMRRGQAVIAQRQHFEEGELCNYRDRTSFQSVANIAAAKYFHQATNGEVYPAIRDLYTDFQVVAPILQRLPHSFKLDWSTGHVLTWVRTGCNDHVKRYFFSSLTMPRTFDADLLRNNLALLGVHDTSYIDILADQYKRHYGGSSLRSHLAHRLFDPVILMNHGEGYRLRVANTIFRLEKQPFPGCLDLRERQAKVLGAFRIRHVKKKGGSFLEILLTHDAVVRFKETVCSIIDSSASPRHKVYVINDRISDVLEAFKYARSAWPQVKDLQNWLVLKMRPLYSTLKDVKRRERGFKDEYIHRRQDSLSLPTPNFFWNPRIVDLSTYLKFMSPYKEKHHE
jgi:hypothetical protein